jgi:hypothetical protein
VQHQERVHCIGLIDEVRQRGASRCCRRSPRRPCPTRSERFSAVSGFGC